MLVITFGKPRYAVVTLLNLPFALAGGVLALWLRGLPFSIPAAVGFIALCGVSVMTGIVGRLPPSLRSRLRTPLRYAPFRVAPSAPAAQFRVPRRSILDPQAMLSYPLSHPAAYSLS